MLERRLKAEGARPPSDTSDGQRPSRRGPRSSPPEPRTSDPRSATSPSRFHLDFVPFGEERFDLALPTEMLSAPEVRRLLDVLTSARARAELSALGYDVRETGNQVALPA